MIVLNYLLSKLRGQEFWVKIFQVIIVRRYWVVLCGDWGFIRCQNIALSVYKIVSTGSIDSLSLFKYLWFGFFGDIDVIKLPPHFRFDIIHVTVIVTHFCTAFMYQNRIQYVRLCPYRLVTFFNILFNTVNSFLVIVRFFINFLMIRFECVDQLWSYFVL